MRILHYERTGVMRSACFFSLAVPLRLSISKSIMSARSALVKITHSKPKHACMHVKQSTSKHAKS